MGYIAVTLDGFTVRNGSTSDKGGGININVGFVKNCEITDNIATAPGNSYGGGIRISGGATLQNSLVSRNFAKTSGGGIFSGSGERCTIKNCTIVSNRAASGGGIHMSGLSLETNTIVNVISFFNTGGVNSNVYFPSTCTGYFYIVNSCIAPTNIFPTNVTSGEGHYYANNIESNPQFVNKDTGDWRLQRTSPCVNAGMNEAWMTGATDLDGRRRLDRFSGIVDMGAYEYLPQGMVTGQ
jgi:predicted outer membrane repeat protein